MSWSDDVDRAFADRRAELLQELIEDGVRVIDELGAVASSCATNHPLGYVGSGVAVGAGISMLRGSAPAGAPAEAPGRRSGWVKTLFGALRFVPLGAFLG